MSRHRADGSKSQGHKWQLLGWGGAAALLLLPLVTGAPWTAFDYLLLAGLLGGAGLVLEMVVRTSSDPFYRAGSLFAVAAAALLFVVNGAVGFLGNEDNPANLVFFGVIAIAASGSVLAGFRATGMARTMFGTAGAQIMVGAGALAAGWSAPGPEGVHEVVMGTTLFGSLWLISAGLFRKAAGAEPDAPLLRR